MTLFFLLSNENLKNIFLSPSSIAVIGASEKPGVGKGYFFQYIERL